MTFARTSSRRVLGYLNHNAVHIDYALHRLGGLANVDGTLLNRELQRTLHGQGGGRYAEPLELVRRRLGTTA